MSRQSRAYNGMDYSRCKSMDELIKNIGQAIERNDMEFELMRQTDTEPRDLKEWSKQGAKEDAR